jgi:hypothetical protein
MDTRKDRLIEVYEYLRSSYGIHTKTQFAVALNMTQPALSAAINGNEKYLTDNLFKKICAAYQGVFNLDYLLTGEGELLSKGTHETRTPAPASASGDSELVQELRNRIADKDCIIAGRDELIRKDSDHGWRQLGNCHCQDGTGTPALHQLVYAA